MICNRISSKSDGFKIAISFNPCPSTAFILVRLKFVTLKTYGFKVTETNDHIDISEGPAKSLEAMLND